MSGESHSGLKFHVYVGVESPEIAGVSRKRVQLSRGSLLSAKKRVATKVVNQVRQPDLVMPILYHILLAFAIDGEFLEVP